jgi:exopolysaccharide biosynthesis polyprenyl glycosylphosphotransferase
MLRRDKLIRMQFHELLDACLFALAFWLAYQVRSNEHLIQWFRMDPVSPFEKYVWLYLVLVPAAPTVLEAQGFYNRPLLCSRLTTAWLLLKGCGLVSLGLVVSLFVFRVDIARWVIVWFGALSFVLVFAKEEITLWILRGQMASSQFRRRFILIGTDEETARMRADLKAKSHDTIQVAGEMNLIEQPVQRLIEMLHEYSVNGVIISAKRANFDQVEAAISACEVEGVDAWLVADFFKTQICRTSFDEFLDRPVMVFSSTPEASWQGVAKQLLDFSLALVMLLILSPFLVLIALLIKVTSPGPVLFRQQRSGLNGHPFTIYKFRTMVTNAEQLKHELAAMNEMSGPVFKVTNDPRITPFGTFLRKYSIDEFPQLLNVLRGEMSLVGPRPLPVDEVRRFNDLAHRRRLSVKPGLTCLWQISGRNEVKDFRDWVRLDLEYIDNWSLWLDLKILCRTVPVVLVGTGAK